MIGSQAFYEGGKDTMGTNVNQFPEIPKAEVTDHLNVEMYMGHIFRAALELQLWAKVAAGEDTAEKMAAKEGWDPNGTRMLLNDICSLKLLVKQDNRYYLTPEAEYYLLPDKPTYTGQMLLSEFNWEGNGQLAEAIRTGKRPIHYKAMTAEVAAIWPAVYVSNWTAPESYLQRSDALWQTIGIQACDGLRVLDLACGPAPRSFALARQRLGVRVTLLDWEPILKIALKLATALGVEKQVTTLAADLWSADYGSHHFDVAYMGNITHFFGFEENIRLFRKVYDALVSEGVIVVNAVRREYPDPMAPELWFYAVSEDGAAYDFADYKDMLERAGYRDIEDVSTQPIKATKP
jgi:SAM-dependent methyltransferase